MREKCMARDGCNKKASFIGDSLFGKATYCTKHAEDRKANLFCKITTLEI